MKNSNWGGTQIVRQHDELERRGIETRVVNVGDRRGIVPVKGRKQAA